MREGAAVGGIFDDPYENAVQKLRTGSLLDLLERALDARQKAFCGRGLECLAALDAEAAFEAALDERIVKLVRESP